MLRCGQRDPRDAHRTACRVDSEPVSASPNNARNPAVARRSKAKADWRSFQLRLDSIKARRVRGHDVPPCTLGQDLERISDLFDHSWIGAVEVRKIGTPKYVSIESDLAHRGQRALVRIERQVTMLGEILGRTSLEPWRHRSHLFVMAVHAVQPISRPPYTRFQEGDPEPGKSFEYAAEITSMHAACCSNGRHT